jgi:hypothetical protein
MNSSDLSSTLLAGLLELEQSGDLVITHPAPLALADQLCAKVIEKWGKEALDDPIEPVLDLAMKISKNHLIEIFKLTDTEAESAVKSFLRSLETTRTPKEVAELVCHQGFGEIAVGAFFCAHLRRGEYYSSDYLDWRMNLYAQRKRQ